MAGTLNLGAFHLSFDDEFNSFTSSPNGSTGWQTTFFSGGRTLPSNGEQEYYSDSSVGINPFSLQNGELTITAAPGSNPGGLAYNSGLITTEGDFTQTYGYFEMRAELPQGAGMWPGFWLLNANNSWPPEIDVLEAFGAPNANGEGGANQAHVNVISRATTSTGASEGGGEWTTTSSNIYTGYHTYGVDWEPDYTTFYIDGQEVYQVATPTDMNQPMYMLANLAVGGSWVGSPAGETSQMKIDYIRAYSKDPNVATVAMQTVSSPDGATTTSSTTGTTTTGTTTSGTSSSSTTTTSSSNSLTVHVSEDAWNGNAQFTVFVDGQQIGGTQTATASHALGQWQDITLTGNFDTGAHTVDVNFINDAWGGSAATDRNLYVQSVTVNGQTLSGALAHDTAANGIASADTSAAVMAINGTAEFHSAAASSAASTSTSGASSSTGTSTGTLTLHVSEDAWNGNAQFNVFVDGQQVGGTQTATASHALGQWQDITLAGSFAAGAHTVDVNFINDAWGGTTATDRNLYVQSVTLNGQTVSGAVAHDTAANGYASDDTSAAVMMVNGTSEFSFTSTSTTTASTPANPTSTLVLHISEDAWNGNAQFNVFVDGKQIGGTQTATASHAAGQTQDITLTGDFGATGPGKIDISFLNDAWGGTSVKDRNLYVESLDINGVHFNGNTAANTAANGHASVDPTAAVMDINGTAEFNINHTAPPEIMG